MESGSIFKNKPGIGHIAVGGELEISGISFYKAKGISSVLPNLGIVCYLPTPC